MTPRSITSIESVALVATALTNLRTEAVFVGAAILPLYVGPAVALQIRPTRDVDFAFNIGGVAAFQKREGELRDRGFEPDISDEPPLACRYRVQNIVVDMVSAQTSKAQTFTNEWYRFAFDDPMQATVHGVEINIPSAPVYLATKLEAFFNRGIRDWHASTDLEDIVSLVEGRDELAAEIVDTHPKVRAFVAKSMASLLALPGFRDYLVGAVTQGPGHGVRADLVFRQLQAIASHELSSAR